MERLLHHAYVELRGEARLAVVGPSGCEAHLQPDTRVLSCPALPPARFLAWCQWQTLRLARSFRPDLILSGSGVTAPASRSAGFCLDIPVICFLHGLDIVAASPAYRMVFLPSVRSCNALLVNSRNTARLAAQAKIDASRIHILFPGVAVATPAGSINHMSFRARIGASHRPILLSVGRLTKRKGLVEFIDQALPQIVRECPEALLVVIGHEARQSLQGTQSMTQQIREMAVTRGLVNNIMMLDRVDDGTLWEAYASSQVFVFPVIDQPGDVEGFGMVALEAAAHGIATVAFATGGVVDAVRDGISGYLAKSGDYRKFAELVLNHLQSSTPSVSSESCVAFARQFSWQKFGQQLREICSTVISQSKTERRTPAKLASAAP